MGENSGIGWTGNTVNFWWGCEEVGPGCDGCYARVWAERLGKQVWGPGVPRLKMPNAYKQPDTWDRRAIKLGQPIKVFCQSMSDFFDNEVDPAWRAEAWPVIKRTKNLRYQILTKRVSNIAKMLPADWGPDYAHVGFMCTVVNQQEANRDVPRLLKVKDDHKVTWVGLSVEPMLDRVDLTAIECVIDGERVRYNVLSGALIVLDSDSPDAYVEDLPRLDWVIVGGESAKGTAALTKCRPYDMGAALALVQQCQANDVPVFHKQLGSKPVVAGAGAYHVPHWKGEVPEQWPAEFRVQQFPPALLQ